MVKEPLKYYLERTTFIGRVARFHRQRRLKKKYNKWQKTDAAGPMPNYGKQQVVIDYIKRFRPEVFIETGTYKGKMVYAVMPYIDKIYSIELAQTHFENAQKQFAGYPDIKIIRGQSGEVLPKLLDTINQKCLFWLDAHYSSGSTARGELDSPIEQELDCIFRHGRIDEHIILIDDARCFLGRDGYPTLDKLKDFILRHRQDWICEIENDIIRAHKKDKND